MYCLPRSSVSPDFFQEKKITEQNSYKLEDFIIVTYNTVISWSLMNWCPPEGILKKYRHICMWDCHQTSNHTQVPQVTSDVPLKTFAPKFIYIWKQEWYRVITQWNGTHHWQYAWNLTIPALWPGLPMALWSHSPSSKGGYEMKAQDTTPSFHYPYVPCWGFRASYREWVECSNKYAL